METTDTQVVALDAQALRDGAWPNPNAKLYQLAGLAHHFNQQFWLIQGALDEVRGQDAREAKKATDELIRARDTARRKRLKAEATCTDLDGMLADWDQHSTEACRQLIATLIPYTPRPVEHFFDMGVRRVPPFKEKGDGFRDAIIYYSLVDEMARLGLSSAIFVSEDRGFLKCASPIEGQQIHVMGLDDAIEKFRARLTESWIKENLARQEMARKAIRLAAPDIEAFISENLDIGQTDLPGLGGQLKKPLSYRFADVDHLTLAPWYRDVPPGNEIQASGLIELDGEFEIIPFSNMGETRVSLGEDLEVKKRFLAVLGGELIMQTSKIVTVQFWVSADLSLKRTAEGYADVTVSRISHASLDARALSEMVSNALSELRGRKQASEET
ncbi:MAG: DUF4935 domain-containing protein [Candidatus Tectomicrobia bacterium]|nr:DUF4935 domain-containing protein [Candidatus Tectomicrobia bacterium]